MGRPGFYLALWPAASANRTGISRLPARQPARTETLNVSQTHVVSSTPYVSKNASPAVSQTEEREKGTEGVREWTVMATWCVLCSLLGASLPNKEFVEESFKKALQGREKDTSTRMTAELERASSGKKGDTLSAFLGLLIKLLSEQQEVKVSKEEQDTHQWRNESYKTEKREAKGDQEARESSELATEFPEYGHNGKFVVAIPVIIGAITFIVIFCFVAIYCHRTSSKDGKEGSSRGFFSILRHTRCSPEHTTKDISSGRQPLWLRDLYRRHSERCIENMAQELHDRASSAEDELYYQM